MELVTSVGEALALVQQAKLNASDFQTNFFPVEARLQTWIARGELSAASCGDSVFLFRRDRSFFHLFFCSRSIAALGTDVSTLPEKPLVADLVGPADRVSAMLTAFDRAGFRRYLHLSRMARRAAPLDPAPKGEEDRVELATAADGPAISSLLENVFDPLGEQIPLSYEVDAAIAAGQIIVARAEGAVAALLFFETHGLTTTLRFWAVDERFRSLRLGSALMRRYLAMHHAARRFLLWVSTGNDAAIEKYRHYGYEPDGVQDQVVVNVSLPL